MTVASLGIAVDSGQAVTADANLRRMTAAAGQAEAVVTKLGGGSKSAASAIAQLNAAANGETVAQERATAAVKMHNAALQAQTTNARLASFQQRNLAYQMIDVFQSFALGMPVQQVLLQQGPQIAQIYGTSEGGIGRAFAESGKMIGGFALAAWPVVAVMAALGLGVAGLTHEINETTKVNVGFMDTLKAVGQTLWATFTNFIKPVTNTIGGLFSAAWDAVVVATKWTMNYLINSVVGAVKTIGALWNGLPAALGDIGIVMANTIVTAFEGAINKAGDLLNAFIQMANKALPGLELGEVGKVELPKFANPLAGSKDRLGGTLTDIANENVDYAGGFFSDVRAQAIKNAIAGDKDMAKAAKEATKELERQAKAYADIVLNAEQFVSSQELAAQSLGMSAEAAAALKYQQELLNKAANDNIDLTPKQTAQLMELGTAMAAAEEATRRLTEIYDTGKQIFSSFFGDLKTGIEDGKGLWGSLGEAASNALDTIANKALEMAANGIWDMIFGSLFGTGGGGGGFNLGSLFGIGKNADGTDNWRGGLSWVGEQGPELMNIPRGAQIIPHQKSMAMTANQNQSNDNMPSIQIIDQRQRGTIKQEQGTGPNGEKQLRLIIRDEVQQAQRRGAVGF